MNNIPNISVIVPVYNAEKYLEKCLSSIIKQTFTDFEVIIVEDKSIDNSYEICKIFAASDKRIKLIQNSENQGSSLSRRIGINNATGKYIQFIDSDDWIDNNMFERLITTTDSGSYDIVWHDFFGFNEDYRKQNIDYTDKIDILKKLFNSDSGLSSALWNKFAKKEFYLNLIFPKAMQWEDLVITIQLLRNVKNIKYLPEAFYHHVNNPDSISQSKDRRSRGLKEIIENMEFVITYCREYLGDNFIKLEPELSACVNRFKFESIFIKELRNIKIVTKLYPESNLNIFSKILKISFYKKLMLFIYIKISGK